MPIYAYRCEACGHAKDVLQKVSDAPLTQCPSCGADAFRKQVTAAGFQLKGSGWYVTDFRGGAGASKGKAGADDGDTSKSATAKSEPAASDAGKTTSGEAKGTTSTSDGASGSSASSGSAAAGGK